MIAQDKQKDKTPLEWAVYYYETDTAMTTRMESARFYLELAKVEALQDIADSMRSLKVAVSYYVDMETADE